MDTSMRLALACIALTLAAIAAVWVWLGTPSAMPHAPLKPGQKLWCLSYAPFQGSQTPHDPTIVIPAAQIEADIAQMSKMTDCVRIYATDQGLENVVPIAKRYGMQVLQGAWVSSDPVKTRIQIDAALAIAERYPETVRAIIVGNEALLRGDISGPDLAALIRDVKAKAKVPVTYADVWEFWLRSPEVAANVDFITIHILPYWEDFPIPARQAAEHVDAIRKRIVAAFAPKDVVIGEFGWPSQGRMREGARPSPANQAEVIQDVLALAARENYRVNVIEAYDATWKRAQEGVVGGYWGLFDASHRQMKFAWGAPVSNHPEWRVQAAGGIAFAVLVFGVAFWTRRVDTPSWLWPAISLNALAGGITIGWTIVNVPIESIGAGGWVRLLALAAAAVHFFPRRNTLVIGLGSCITYNFINQYHQLIGGSISPGKEMRFRAMHEFTAKLPAVSQSWHYPLVAYDTATNMQCGVQAGMAAEIDGIIGKYQERYGNFNAVLTGGDSAYFATKLKRKIFADFNFLFKGLYAISELNTAAT